MNDAWYYLLAGELFGPISKQELVGLCKRSLIPAATMVSRDQHAWFRATDAFAEELATEQIRPNEGTGGATSAAFEAHAQPAYSTREVEQWFLHSFDGKQFGPVPLTELEGWATDGSITRGCRILRSSEPTWRLASTQFENLPPPPVSDASTHRTGDFTFASDASAKASSVTKPQTEGEFNGAAVFLGIIGFIALMYFFIPTMQALKASGWLAVIFGVIAIGRLIVAAASKR